MKLLDLFWENCFNFKNKKIALKIFFLKPRVIKHWQNCTIVILRLIVQLHKLRIIKFLFENNYH